MLSFVVGVVVGAAFAPVWMKLWEAIKTTAAYAWVMSFFNKL